MSKLANLPLWIVLSTLSSIAPVVADQVSQRHFAVGMSALSQNRNQDALDQFVRAIEADGKSADGYIGRAVYYRKSGELDLARKDVDVALHLEPQRPGVWQTSGEIWLQSGDYARAITDSTKAIEISDRATAAYFTRGVAYRESGRLDEAVRDFDFIIARDNTLPRPLLERSKVLVLRGKLQEALSDLDLASSLAPAGSVVGKDIAAFRDSLSNQTTELAQSDQELDESPPDDGGVGFGTPPDDEINVGKLQRRLDQQVADLKGLSDRPEDFAKSMERAKAIYDKLYATSGKSMGLSVGPHAESDWVLRYRDSVEQALTFSKRRIEELQASARKAPAIANPRRAAFEARARASASSQEQEIDALGISGSVMDSKIVLRELIVGMPPTPWITLRQWIGLVLESGEYQIVDVRKNDDETVWELVLKKPAEPTVTLAFRYDYGDLFSYGIGTGDDFKRTESTGVMWTFANFLALRAGFTFEDL